MPDEIVKDTITIKGQEISITRKSVLHRDLEFYKENPRIYSIVCADGSNPSQEEIEERLSKLEHVKGLVQSIKANEGLTEPLLVRKGIVLEGNSRLAAYRLLAKQDPIRWAYVKVQILPDNTPDDIVFAQLGIYHIIGRQDWAPYEQAGLFYRRIKIHGATPDTIQQELGLSIKTINKLVEIYEFMIDKGDNDIKRWSYYDEYLKSSRIAKARAVNPQLDEVVVKQIKNGDIGKAENLRDKLKVVVTSSRVLKDYISEKLTLDESYERVIDGGAGNVIYQKLHRFRDWCAQEVIEEDLKELDVQTSRKCIFEINKIHKRMQQLSEIIER